MSPGAGSGPAATRGPDEVVVRPASGGVAGVAAELARRRRDDARQVHEVVVHETGPAMVGALRVWRRHRESLRGAAGVHVELGRLTPTVFWVLVLICLFRRDVAVVAHDFPVIVKNPGAALLPARHGWLERLAYRVVSPVVDPLVTRWVRHRVGGWGVLSDPAATAASQAGLRSVVRVHLGATAMAEVRPPSEGTHVLFAGYLGRGKGVEELLSAWEQVGGHCDLPLVLAGGVATAADRAWLAQLQVQAGPPLNPPRWAGPLDDEEFDGVFADAAVVVLPYRVSNPASGILVRAMSHGRPVVVTSVEAAQCCGVSDAAAVVLDSLDDLASVVGQLVADPQRRNELGRRARDHVRSRHTWAGHLAAVDELHRRTRGRAA